MITIDDDISLLQSVLIIHIFLSLVQVPIGFLYSWLVRLKPSKQTYIMIFQLFFIQCYFYLLQIILRGIQNHLELIRGQGIVYLRLYFTFISLFSSPFICWFYHSGHTFPYSPFVCHVPLAGPSHLSHSISQFLLFVTFPSHPPTLFAVFDSRLLLLIFSCLLLSFWYLSFSPSLSILAFFWLHFNAFSLYFFPPLHQTLQLIFMPISKNAAIVTILLILRKLRKASGLGSF